jgi:hypothetical protein
MPSASHPPLSDIIIITYLVIMKILIRPIQFSQASCNFSLKLVTLITSQEFVKLPHIIPEFRGTQYRNLCVIEIIIISPRNGLFSKIETLFRCGIQDVSSFLCSHNVASCQYVPVCFYNYLSLLSESGLCS